MPFTDASVTAILNSYCKGYIGLLTSAPSDPEYSEISGTGYARVNISSIMHNTSARVLENDADIIYFPEAESAWGTATYFAIFGSSEGGTMKCYGALDSSVSITANTVPLFRVGKLKFTLN